MGEQIRIDDLAAPSLNDVQRMALDYGESKHTELTVDAVCDAASARTGLADFGPPDFEDRLRVQLDEMDADEERTGLGRLLMFGDCTRYAANRLLIRDLLERHPEILEIPIERPVIVVGLPRSGTTHLVNLLAADSRFRSMPLWESYEPVPNPKDPETVDGRDPRWARCEGAWAAMQAAAPLVAAMQHLEQLGPLLGTFPDATIVVTHRDPVAVVQSTITMACYGARTAYRTTKPEWYRDYWTDRIGRLLDASLRDRHLLPAERTVDVLFHEYMADELGLLERIYECAGMVMTGTARAEVTSYLDAHPRGKEGRVVYDLRRDFDTTPDEIRGRFGAYLDRFAVRIEVS